MEYSPDECIMMITFNVNTLQNREDASGVNLQQKEDGHIESSQGNNRVVF